MRVPSEVEHKKLPVLVMSPKAELEKCAFNYVPGGYREAEQEMHSIYVLLRLCSACFY